VAKGGCKGGQVRAYALTQLQKIPHEQYSPKKQKKKKKQKENKIKKKKQKQTWAVGTESDVDKQNGQNGLIKK
jgi:hypothetical protein